MKKSEIFEKIDNRAFMNNNHLRKVFLRVSNIYLLQESRKSKLKF